MRRKLKNLGFPDKYVGRIMTPGMLDLVTVLPAADVSDIDGKGWFFISSLIDTPQADKDVEEWRNSLHGRTMIADFFFYIQQFWLDILPTWNWAAFLELDIMDPDEEGIRFIPRFRASAYIESYNGEIGRQEHPHPKLSLLIDLIKKEQEKILKRVEYHRKNRNDPPQYQEIDFPLIPHDEYHSFEGKKSLGKRFQGKRAILTIRPRGAPERKK